MSIGHQLQHSDFGWVWLWRKPSGNLPNQPGQRKKINVPYESWCDASSLLAWTAKVIILCSLLKLHYLILFDLSSQVTSKCSSNFYFSSRKGPVGRTGTIQETSSSGNEIEDHFVFLSNLCSVEVFVAPDSSPLILNR